MNHTLYIDLKLQDPQWQQELQQLIEDNNLPGPPPASDSKCLTVADENIDASESSQILFANYDNAPIDFFPALKRRWAIQQTAINNLAACESLQILGDDAEEHLQKMAEKLKS